MADLEISEYAYTAPPRLASPAGQEPEEVFTLLSYTVSTQHTFNSKTQLVRLKARDSRVYVKFGEDPTAAVATSKSLEQNVVEYFEVRPGMKLAAYDGVS